MYRMCTFLGSPLSIAGKRVGIRWLRCGRHRGCGTPGILGVPWGCRLCPGPPTGWPSGRRRRAGRRCWLRRRTGHKPSARREAPVSSQKIPLGATPPDPPKGKKGQSAQGLSVPDTTEPEIAVVLVRREVEVAVGSAKAERAVAPPATRGASPMPGLGGHWTGLSNNSPTNTSH